jgi:hypothetical protein
MLVHLALCAGFWGASNQNVLSVVNSEHHMLYILVILKEKMKGSVSDSQSKLS